MKTIIREPDGDLDDAFRYNPQEGLSLSDIKNQLAVVPGEADSLDWHWVVKLNNGKFAYLTGGCDYTGWDCQSGLGYEIADSAIKAAKLAKEDGVKKSISQQLLDQLKGKQPYGVREA